MLWKRLLSKVSSREGDFQSSRTRSRGQRAKFIKFRYLPQDGEARRFRSTEGQKNRLGLGRVSTQINQDIVLVAIHTKGHHVDPNVVIQVGVAWDCFRM